MRDTTLETRFASLRSDMMMISDALQNVPGSPWYPADDPEFWRMLNEFEAAGHRDDDSKAPWLAGFVLIDDLGPLGRGMFLAMAALLALAEMPEAATEIVHETVNTFPHQASVYRKTGLCKLVEASNLTKLPPLVETFLSDTESRVRAEALSLQKILNCKHRENLGL